MGIFNYNRFHYFDKDGNELILKKDSPVKFQLKNTNDPTSQSEYVFVRSLPDQNDSSINQIAANGVFDKTTDGHRYSIELSGDGKQTNSLIATINNENRVIPAADFAKPVSYTSNLGVQYSPVLGDTSALKAHILDSLEVDSIPFPSCTFESKITFSKVSTELVETQSICVLIDNEYVTDNINVNKYTTVREYAEDASTAGDNDPYSYIKRFKLFFFIDNREQNDFRLFTTNGSNVIWSDRLVLDLNNESTDYVFENGFRVDVGFCGKQEGVYEQDMYVCLLDTYNDNMVYPIGTIHMSAETVGEDERYRTFFTNFGIPDPKEYDNVFRETPNIEDGIDYISINKHSKQMFLSYSEIFPYIGTYKALINAIKTLGYEDILFKEWYKELGDNTYDDGGYVSYNINFNDPTANKISNTPLEERIHLKKMNWITMFYNINEEANVPVDQWGFPAVISKSNYYTTNNVVKVISLKRWLEKYITGVNCRITGISGEGVVFERYSLPRYGGYQQVFDYRNSKPVYPIVLDDAVSIKDSSAYINVEISTSTGGITFEEAEHQSFQDYCEGYFDSTNKFHSGSNVVDSSLFVYYGKTFEQNETYGQLDLVSKCETKNYRISNDIIDSSTTSLIIDNDRIMFDQHDLASKPRIARFTELPVIQIKKGYIKSYDHYNENTGDFSYFAKIDQVDSSTLRATTYRNGTKSTLEFKSQEYVTLTPPRYKHDSSILITPVSRYLNTNSSTSIIEENAHNDYTTSAYSNEPAMSDPDAEIIYTDFDSYTYGLVYDTDNVNGIPCFKITGYESEYIAFDYGTTGLHFPYIVTDGGITKKPSKYYIEILEGRMIFYSAENDEDVVIKFSQYENGNQKIDVEIYKRTNCKLQYKYHQNSTNYIHAFHPGTIYRYFVSNYKTDSSIDSAIVFDNLAKIKVFNEGKYSISAILQDEYNNVFTAKSAKNTLVNTSDVSILGLGGYTGQTKNITAEDKKDSSICILEYTPKLLINSIDLDSMTIDLNGVAEYKENSGGTDIEDNNGTLVLNGYNDDYKFISIANTADRFDMPIKTIVEDTSVADIPMVGVTTETPTPRTVPVYGVTQEGTVATISVKATRQFTFRDIYHFVKKTPDSSNIFSSTFTETNFIARKTSEHMIPSGQNNAYGMLMGYIYPYENTYIEGTNADVYVIIFDNICDKPVAARTAAMCSTHVPQTQDNKQYEYILAFYDELPNEWENMYFKNSRYSIYVSPAWALNVKKNRLTSTDALFVEFSLGYSNITYTFQDHQMEGLYKILYSDSSKKYFGQYTADASMYYYYGDKYLRINASNTNLMVDASLWVAPMCSEFTSYKLTGKAFDTSNFMLTLDDTRSNKEILKYINNTFTVTRRKFDIDNAIDSWMIPSISTIRHKGEKFEVESAQDVVFKIDSNQATKYQIETRKWSIYRRNNKSDRELYFECFNNVLFMKNLKQGIYDIELTAYDKHGNKYFKRLDGYLTVK